MRNIFGKSVAAAALALLAWLAVAQEHPISVSTPDLPPECTLVCRQRVDGDNAVPDKGAAQQLVKRYEQAKTDNAAASHTSVVYDYGAKFLEGATGAESVPLVSGATKVVVHAMEERSKALKSQYDEAVTKQLLIEADRQLDAHAIDPVTGHVNVEALKKGGSLDWMTSDDFYTNVAPENREAIKYARGNWEIKSLASVAATVQITQKDIQNNGERLQKLGNAVEATEAYVVTIGKVVEKENIRIKKLAAESKAASDRLQKIMLSQLPARQKLALAEQNVITISAADKASFKDEVLADKIKENGATAAHAMRSVAKLAQSEPWATTVDQLAQITELGASICASYLTGNVAGVALGVLDLVGTVSAFGPPKPSPEVMLLKAVLRKLDEIDQKLDRYHMEEMQALTKIHQEIQAFRAEVLIKLAELQLEEWGAIKAALQVNAAKVQPCAEASESFDRAFIGYRQWSLDEFDRWFVRENASYYLPCVNGLSSIWEPWTPGSRASVKDISVLFIPPTPQGTQVTPDVERELEKAKNTLQTQVAPMLAYLEKYRLWDATKRSYFRAPVDSYEALQQIASTTASVAPFDYAAPLAVASLLTDKGGSHFIDEASVLTLSQQSRTVLSWTPTVWVDSTGQSARAATLSDLKLCAKTSESCQLADWNKSLKILKSDERVLRWLIEQEQLIAGLPAVHFAALTLEAQVIPAYDAARSGKTDGKDLQKLLTRPSCEGFGCTPNVRIVAPRADCARVVAADVDTRARDTLCLMQSNPLFADNVIAYLTWRRVRASNSAAAYGVGSSWPTPAILAEALGSDLRLFDASAAPVSGPQPPDERAWSVELPRVFTEARDAKDKVIHRTQDESTPASCWEERTPDASLFPESNWWIDELRVGNVTVVADKSWARCYLLPAAAMVEAQRFHRRDGFGDIEAELAAVINAEKALTPVFTTGVSSP